MKVVWCTILESELYVFCSIFLKFIENISSRRIILWRKTTLFIYEKISVQNTFIYFTEENSLNFDLVLRKRPRLNCLLQTSNKINLIHLMELYLVLIIFYVIEMKIIKCRQAKRVPMEITFILLICTRFLVMLR